MRRTRSSRLLAIGATGALLALVIGTPAVALPPDQVGVYPSWSVSGTTGAFAATPDFAASAEFPAVSVASDATSISSPIGVGNWFNQTTGFGAEFGSSRNQPYLLIGTATGQSPSTTTLSFADAPPAGWGFALGDIDADWVFVTAYADAERTVPLSVAELGFETAGNACLGSPRPGACSAAGLTFESPAWVTETETFDGITYQPATLRGSLQSAEVPSLDTAGAYGWFRPTVPVRVVDLLFGARAGFPTYSLTMASPAPKTTITGTAAPAPAGTAVTVAEPDGTPVLDLEGAPITVPVATDGTYTFEAEQRDGYLLDPTVPEGYVDPPPFLVAADEAAVVAPPISLAALPPVAETPEPTPAVTEDPNLLAVSGTDGAPIMLVGFALLAAGVALVRARRRPRVE